MDKYQKALNRIEQVIEEEGIVLVEGMRDYVFGRIEHLLKDLDEASE